MKNISHFSIVGRVVVLLALVNGFQLSIRAQLDPSHAVLKHEIPTLKYPAADAFVISLNVMDYGADNTGTRDNYDLFAQLLGKLKTTHPGGAGNGGVLFLPEGIYRLNRSLIIPKGVTIRGEWEKPVKGQSIRGTIITTDLGRGTENEQNSLIRLEPAAAVKDIAFWYPEQKADDIQAYPPTILWGRQGHFGNEYCVAQNITLINSYSGVIFSRQNGGGAPNAFGIYGTPLKRGIEIDNIAEVGRVEGVDFSPEYWAGSGLEGAPVDPTSLKSWMKKNGTAIVMRRNDWTLVSDVKAEGYFIGFHAVKSVRDDSKPNGQNYKMTFTDCVTGVYAQDPQSCGIMFQEIKTVDCEYGLYIPDYASGVVQFSKSDFSGRKYAIASGALSATRILLEQSTVSSGKVEVLGGTLVVMDSDFNNDAPQIKLGPDSRAALTGNRFKTEADISNNSMYKCEIDHSPLADDFKKIPDFPYKDPRTIKQKPDRAVLYVVTDEPFGAKADGTTDNTQAIQAALNQAGQEGGGVVYLPAGKYKVTGNLVVPTGVEIKGSMDVGTPPVGPGSVIEVYADKNNENGQPFMKLSEKSGIRGISFNYPEQKFTELLDAGKKVINPYTYPYCLQVTGKEVYIINIGFRATYSAIDLFTYKCDETYIEYPAGHLFKNGVRIGKGGENIRINNAQFNTIGYACGGETKYGVWPNSPKDTQPGKEDNKPSYLQNYRDIEFFTIGECKNLMLFNNFLFGCNKGFIFSDDGEGPSGIGLGNAIDAGLKSFYFEKIGKDGFDLIGSQIVSLKNNTKEIGLNENAAAYIETAESFTGTASLFSIDMWGEPYYGVRVGGGTLDLHLAHFQNPGSERFAEIAQNGILKIWGCSVKPRGDRPINAGREANFFAESSIITPGNISQGQCGRYLFNLADSPALSISNPISRNGWIATASLNNNNARNAIDGNVSTRWDTGRSQEKGQWFAVDMIVLQHFNKIILDLGSSSNDHPRGYELYFSNDGMNWGDPVMTGQGTESVTTINLPEPVTTRYIRLIQTGSTGGYWSIHEFYIANVESQGIEEPSLIKESSVWKLITYSIDGNLFIEGLPANASLSVYNLAGQVVASLKGIFGAASPIHLSKGIYMLALETEGKIQYRKVLVN